MNVAFFITHPIFTPYYTFPIEMLSLWTLLFATLDAGGSGGRWTFRAGGSSLTVLWNANSETWSGRRFEE